MNKYDEAMEIICLSAKFKMALNSHKGEITDLNLEDAISNAKKELDELYEAAKKSDHEKVVIEAGDCFNFIMSIVLNSMHSYRNRKKVRDSVLTNIRGEVS